MFIGRTDAEAEAPTVWPPDAKSQLSGKDPDAGKDWGQEKKMATEGEMVKRITDSVDKNLSKVQEMGEGRGTWHAAVRGVAESETA